MAVELSYYYGYEAEQFSFYRIPKLLFTDSRFAGTAKLMFANSEFLLMFNQAATDRIELAKLLGTSDTQMDHVNNAPAGHGLIKVGGAIVPFINDFPKDTELYRLMSTRPGEG